MAERAPWLKLWITWINDISIQGLTLEDQARWAILLTLTKDQGNAGVLTITEPALHVSYLLKCTFDEVKAVCKRLPSVTVDVTANSPETITLTWKHWNKYQVDNSAKRTRKWRAKRKQKGDDTSDGGGDGAVTSHETSRSLSPSLSLSMSSSLSHSESKNGKKGTRIPQEFSLTPERIECAKKLGILDPQPIFDQFRDYWTAKAGKDAVKLDWDATLRNWFRNQNSYTRGNGSKVSVKTVSKWDDPEKF